MNFNEAFKSIVENLEEEICLVDTDHVIRYMNRKSIERYAHRGGEKLIGQSLFDCHNENSVKMINRLFDMFNADPNLKEIKIGYNSKHDETNYMVAVRDSEGKLIGYYERHEEGKR